MRGSCERPLWPRCSRPPCLQTQRVTQSRARRRRSGFPWLLQLAAFSALAFARIVGHIIGRVAAQRLGDRLDCRVLLDRLSSAFGGCGLRL